MPVLVELQVGVAGSVGGEERVVGLLLLAVLTRELEDLVLLSFLSLD